MSSSDLEHWMKTKGKTAVDIAAALKIDPTTVKRFLKGKTVRPIIQAGLERLMAEDPAKRQGTRALG